MAIVIEQLNARIMATTDDNPYDPFTDFDRWFQYDYAKGYHTCEWIDRFAKTSNAVSDSFNNAEFEEGVQKLCYYNVTGNYRIVKNPNYKESEE